MIVPKRNAESFESTTSSAPASVKVPPSVDGAAARDPDGEWAMSRSRARVGVADWRCGRETVRDCGAVNWMRSEPTVYIQTGGPN